MVFGVVCLTALASKVSSCVGIVEEVEEEDEGEEEDEEEEE